MGVLSKQVQGFLRFTYEDEETEEEIEAELPTKNEVCSRCEGYGKHLHPDIGGHAYTMEEFNDSFDDEEKGEYFKRGGRYDVQCEECGGNKVVQVVDEDQCTTEKQKLLLKLYYAKEEQSAMFAAQDAHERRMGY